MAEFFKISVSIVMANW